MAGFPRRHNPNTISDQVKGLFPLREIRNCIIELYRMLDPDALSTIISSGGGTVTPPTPIPTFVTWHANGPYRVDTSVDGAWVVPSSCSISNIYLWRDTAGTSGQTIVDINRRHVTEAPALAATLYVTQANRPTLLFDDSDGLTHAVLPDITALVAGDVVTVDCDEKDAGKPLNFTLTLEIA